MPRRPWLSLFGRFIHCKQRVPAAQDPISELQARLSEIRNQFRSGNNTLKTCHPSFNGGLWPITSIGKVYDTVMPMPRCTPAPESEESRHDDRRTAGAVVVHCEAPFGTRSRIRSKTEFVMRVSYIAANVSVLWKRCGLAMNASSISGAMHGSMAKLGRQWPSPVRVAPAPTERIADRSAALRRLFSR